MLAVVGPYVEELGFAVLLKSSGFVSAKLVQIMVMEKHFYGRSSTFLQHIQIV